MNTITVLRYGTQVRLNAVDMYGFCGRELHPDETDVGFIGLVVGNHVELFNLPPDDRMEIKQNVLGGTELPRGDIGEDDPTAFVCYKVRASDGRELELMDHELEILA